MCVKIYMQWYKKMEVKLSKFVVKVKENLTWGDNQKVALAKGTLQEDKKVEKPTEKNESFDNPDVLKSMMAMVNENNLEARYVLLECSVMEIRKGDEVIEFSREWMDNLSIEEGEKLYNEVEKLLKKK